MSAPLHSDHINYLILRYLQEHGHETTALAFYKDWHRPSEYRDPEALPFAPVVKRDALISVVQDGIFFDQVAAKAQKAGKKFRWAAVNARERLSEEDAAALEDGRVGEEREGERPLSSGKRQGKARASGPPMRAPDEFPTPAPKRQRRSEGSEGVHLNGDRDAMEVDDVSPSADADEDAEGEVLSPAVSAEVDVIQVPERYDSMDVATQTEVKTGPKTSTTYWKIDKPGATVLHSMWNPDPDPKNANTLLTVGESLCRFYEVRTFTDNNVQQITHVDDPNMIPNGFVSASAWHPEGHTAACAVQQDPSDHPKNILQLLLHHGRDHGSRLWDASTSLLEPPGVVLCIRYSPNGTYLLVARTNAEHGLVQIWRTPSATTDDEDDVPDATPIAWRIFDQQVLDVCWVGDEEVMVCGAGGLLATYRVDTSDQSFDSLDGPQVMQRGLAESRPGLTSGIETLDKLRFDAKLGIAILASSETRTLNARVISGDIGASTENGHTNAGPAAEVELPGELTAVAFGSSAPFDETNEDGATAEGKAPSALLAATFLEGFCTVYQVSRASEKNASCEKVTTLELPEGPALALAWSPQGTHLAFGNTDAVHIYTTESLIRQNGVRQQPIVTWRPDASALGKGINGTHRHEHDQEAFSEPSLSWSADGESLGWACERQLAVIRFKPPLHTAENGEAEVNGGTSP